MNEDERIAADIERELKAEGEFHLEREVKTPKGRTKSTEVDVEGEVESDAEEDA
jgi:hypothetical protein